MFLGAKTTEELTLQTIETRPRQENLPLGPSVARPRRRPLPLTKKELSDEAIKELAGISQDNSVLFSLGHLQSLARAGQENSGPTPLQASASGLTNIRTVPAFSTGQNGWAEWRTNEIPLAVAPAALQPVVPGKVPRWAVWTLGGMGCALMLAATVLAGVALLGAPDRQKRTAVGEPVPPTVSPTALQPATHPAAAVAPDADALESPAAGSTATDQEPAAANGVSPSPVPKDSVDTRPRPNASGEKRAAQKGRRFIKGRAHRARRTTRARKALARKALARKRRKAPSDDLDALLDAALGK